MHINTPMSRFFFFFFNLNKKASLAAQFIPPNLVNTGSFIRIHFNPMKTWQPELTKFCNEMYTRRLYYYILA